MEPLYPNGSVALMKQTGFDYDGAVTRPHLEWKNLHQKVYRKRKGLLRIHQPLITTILFAPYEDEPKIVGINESGIFFH